MQCSPLANKYYFVLKKLFLCHSKFNPLQVPRGKGLIGAQPSWVCHVNTVGNQRSCSPEKQSKSGRCTQQGLSPESAAHPLTNYKLRLLEKRKKWFAYSLVKLATNQLSVKYKEFSHTRKYLRSMGLARMTVFHKSLAYIVYLLFQLQAT